MTRDEAIAKWHAVIEEDAPVPGFVGVKFGAVQYYAQDIYDLLQGLASGWRKKWPAEIYAAETKAAKQAILEAFMIGKAKRM